MGVESVEGEIDGLVGFANIVMATELLVAGQLVDILVVVTE